MRKLLFFFVAILLMNCNKEKSPIVSGQVLLSDGTPVENADIHFVQSLNISTKEKLPSRSFLISVSQAGHVRLETFFNWNQELVETLINSNLPSGEHSFQTNSTLYTNGVYNFELSLPGVDTLVTSNFLIALNAEELVGVNPIVKTKSNGEFQIDFEAMGIGERFEEYNYSGSEVTVRTITNIFEFIAIKNGEIIARKEVKLIEEKENEVNLVVSN